ncbi:MAG: hypothetical protein AAF215_04690 [Cyanobacteria bacterium P01_A01_bin.123]
MEPTNDGSLDVQSQSMTFIGGTADLDDPLIFQPDLATPPAPSRGNLPLAMTSVGDRVWVVRIKAKHALVRRLTDVGKPSPPSRLT